MANEKRLIDANALSDEVDISKHNNPHTNGRVRINHYNEHDHFLRMILDAPTVDAVEVVHGHWHIDEYDSGEPDGYAAFIEVHCSKCSYELGAESGQYGWAYGDPFPLNYCPNCGAKMDGGNEDEL